MFLGQPALYYSNTQKYSGHAFRFLGDLKYEQSLTIEARDCYKSSISSYDEALKVFDNNRNLAYMKIYFEQGISYINISKCGSGIQNLNQALDCFEETLEVFTSENDLPGYFGSLNNIGNVFFEMANYEKQKENLGKSIEYYEESLKYIDIEKTPELYSNIQGNINLAESILSKL